MQKNITLDFTTILSIENQPVAIMPEFLAKKLLRDLAERIGTTTLGNIKVELIEDIKNCTSEEEIIQTVTGFIQMRELVANVVEEKWEAYSVTPKEEMMVAIS